MSSIFLSKCGLLNVFPILHHSFHKGFQSIHFSLQRLANFPRSSHHSVWRPSKYPGFHPVTGTDAFGGPPCTQTTSIFPLIFSKTISTHPTWVMVKNPFVLQKFSQIGKEGLLERWERFCGNKCTRNRQIL